MVRMMCRDGKMQPIVLDTLENGHTESIPSSVKLYKGSTADNELLEKIFMEQTIDAVIHFAAYLRVEESVENPIKYMRNNTIGPVALLDTMEKVGCKYLVFSSTAATYGSPQHIPIAEDHPKNPESPYGTSKLAFEHLLNVYDRKSSIRSISLRYFNAAGSEMDGSHGEAHKVETHIIPRAIQAAMNDQPFMLFGTDYATRDGTCERDYIHVDDLCTAHLLAISALLSGKKTNVYNVATGNGVTNKELITELARVLGKPISIIERPRRPGDPDRLVADPSRIMKELHWKPLHSDLPTILRSAVAWHTTHPNGYDNT